MQRGDVMTVVLFIVAAGLWLTYFYARSISRRGITGTHNAITDRLFADPDALRFGGPLPDSSIDYATREHNP